MSESEKEASPDLGEFIKDCNAKLGIEEDFNTPLIIDLITVIRRMI